MYGVVGSGARLLPGTAGAEAGTFALDAAGNATVAWRPHNGRRARRACWR